MSGASTALEIGQMNRYLNKTSAFSMVATLMVTLAGTFGSSAAAENTLASPFLGVSTAIVPVAKPLDLDLPPVSKADDSISSLPAPAVAATITPPAAPASSLAELVAARPGSDDMTGEMKCLAGAIYFEARSESLEGQLAVGRVIVARSKSGRFPASYCGVVQQPSQFSFMHGQTMPSVDGQSPLWQKAVAMARIADAGTWQSSAEGALFFHATRVATNWRMTRVAQIDHHIFYR